LQCVARGGGLGGSTNTTGKQIYNEVTRAHVLHCVAGFHCLTLTHK